MAKESKKSNVIIWRRSGQGAPPLPDDLPDGAEVCDFIAEMLDTLMQMAVEEDHSVLVYLLAMARIEALELKQERNETPSADG